MKEIVTMILEQQNLTTIKVDDLYSISTDNKKDQEDAVRNVLILAVILMLVIIISIVTVMIFMYRRQKKLMEYRTW